MWSEVKAQRVTHKSIFRREEGIIRQCAFQGRIIFPLRVWRACVDHNWQCHFALHYLIIVIRRLSGVKKKDVFILLELLSFKVTFLSFGDQFPFLRSSNLSEAKTSKNKMKNQARVRRVCIRTFYCSSNYWPKSQEGFFHGTFAS